MSTPKPWSGAGLILAFFKLRSTATITEETLEKWFAEEYAPGLKATGVIDSATLYKAANADYNKQNLIVYKVNDIAALQTGAMQKVPRTSSKGLFEGAVDEHIETDSRIYGVVERFEKEKKDEGPEPTIMIALMQPPSGGEAELDKWYREEHNEQMSKEPGWWRTMRYSLLAQMNSSAEKSEELSFLAVHGFGEGNELGTEVKPLSPMTEWTKKLLAEAKGIDAAIYHRVRVF